MTALAFALQPDQVCVAMDTLVVGANDRLPVAFKRKFLSFSFANALVAGTGHAGFINAWFGHLQSLGHFGGIDQLNAMSPGTLDASASAGGGLGETTATIYQFGYSSSEGRYVGYAYRSTHNFQSELLQYGLGVKPQVAVPCTGTDDIRFPEFLVALVKKQQEQDRALPIEQQVGIGGEIEFACLSNHTIQIATVHRFKTYEQEARSIECRV